MPLPPSRKDTIGPPPRDVSDLAAIVRHHESSLQSRDPGYLRGRFGTPSPVRGDSSPLVGDDGGGDTAEYPWEWGDRGTVRATGTQRFRLSHEPREESLFVRWHPDGRGGLPLTNEKFSLDGQVVTIPDPGILVVGDQFSFQYQYEEGDDVLEMELVSCTQGSFAGTQLTFDIVGSGAQAGDFLVVTTRGVVAPGGGDITLGATCADSRVSLAYSAPLPVVQDVWTGFASGSGAPLVVDVIPNASFSPGAKGCLAVFRGVNGVSSITAVTSPSNTGGTTPQVDGTGAVAIVWSGNIPFGTVTPNPPTGYSLFCRTPIDYFATSTSYWFDPEGSASPAGTFTDEGCLIIGLT